MLESYLSNARSLIKNLGVNIKVELSSPRRNVLLKGCLWIAGDGVCLQEGEQYESSQQSASLLRNCSAVIFRNSDKKPSISRGF